jgi:glycosyltransferase involved in cell wall biosynthesis
MPERSLDHPKISVVIPCYNLGQYIDEAVDSVFAQTFRDFEIVIVNDGSTDPETNRLLAGYSRPQTRVLTTTNRGPGAARNAAIREARGEYISALDADDKLHERFLEKTAAVFDESPSTSFVSCWVQMFGDQSWVWKQDRCDLVTLLNECTVATPALVRRQALLAIGAYDEDSQQIGMEDWDLWIRLAEAGFTGKILPEVLFYYRRRPNSLSEFWGNGEAHLDRLRPLIKKHSASYRQYLLDLLLRKQAATCKLLSKAYQLEHDVESRLEPLVERKQQELDRLRARLAAAASGDDGDAPRLNSSQMDGLLRENDELRDAVDSADVTLAAFRTSLSWRITAPLRAVHNLLRRPKADSSSQRRR